MKIDGDNSQSKISSNNNKGSLQEQLSAYEVENYRMQKELKDLAKQENRQMKKKLQSIESLSNQHKEANQRLVDSTKATLKKYETYLDCSEDVINHLFIVYQRENELSQAMLENAYLSEPFEVRQFLRERQNDEDEETFKNAVNRISKSSMLKNKNLFQTLPEKLKSIKNYDKASLQEKYDKLLEKDEEIIRRFKDQQMANLNPMIEESEKEFLFEQYYQNFINHLLIFKNLIKEHYFESFHEEKLRYVAEVMKEFVEVIQLYLNQFKKKLIEDSNVDPQKTEDFSKFNAEVDELHKQLDHLENIQYEKLTGLRDKNDKLNILEQHIQNLQRENEEISKKITQSDFNLLEQDSIIISYEKNLKEKENLLKRKYQQIEESKIKSEELNQKISDALKELVDAENEVNKQQLLQMDMESKLKRSEYELQEKKLNHQKLHQSYQLWEDSLNSQQKEKDKLEKMMEDYQQQLQIFPQTFEQEKKQVDDLEKQIQEKIVKKTKNEIDMEISQVNIKFLKTSIS